MSHIFSLGENDMAISYCRLEMIKRSAGKNLIAKSAYSGKLILKFDGNTVAEPCIYNWRKGDEFPLNHSIFLPDHVDKKFMDPEVLWNYCEKFEKRKDAQVGKEIVLALPDDKVISNEDRIELAHTFSKKFFVTKGYGVQVDIHLPSQHKNYDEVSGELEKNASNYHAHIIITERHFETCGTTFKKKKSHDLTPDVRGSERFAFNGIEWSKEWTQFQNEYFENKGLDLRVDHNGIIPQLHLGPVRMRGVNSYDLLDLQSERAELGRTQLKDAEIVLKKITETKSIFTEIDLELFLHKNLSPQEVSIVKEEFWKLPKIVQLYDKSSKQATEKFTSADVLIEERKILRVADHLNGKKFKQQSGIVSPVGLSEEQQTAFKTIVKGKQLACIEGLAGTGKSYLLIAIKNYYNENGYKVRAFGPDNATAKVLRDKGFFDATNIYQFLFKNYYSKKAKINAGKEVWIVDEASKLGNRPLLELLISAEKNDIKVIFSGNSAQLSSVERGGMFSVFSNRYGHVFLKDIQRQKKTIDRDIAKRLACGDVGAAVNMISTTGGFIWCTNKEEALLCTVEKWAKDREHFPKDANIMIAHTNKDVRQLNDLAHRLRRKRGEIGEKEFECHTIFGKIRLSEGDLIEIRANDKGLKVENGQVGVLIHVSERKFEMVIDKKKISFDPRKFSAFQLGYATTYFRSQGSTFVRSNILYSKHMNKKLLYVGMTRHQKTTSCFVSRSEASCLMDIKKQLLAEREVSNTIGYTSLEEINKQEKGNQRKIQLQGLCGSDNILSRLKGYSFKAWDLLADNLGLKVERVLDSRPSKEFYHVKNIEKNKQGNAVEIKESSDISHFCEKSQPLKSSSSVVNSSEKPFKRLSENQKSIYRDYFGISEKASTLYAIVQSESLASSIPTKLVASFEAWQKTCGERNKKAYELLRSDSQPKAILGEKGFAILKDQSSRYEQSIDTKNSLESIEVQLCENIESLLNRLFPEGPQRRGTRDFRFGSNGSLSVTCVGEKRGSYHDFENKEGGGLIQLIERKEGLNRQQAVIWAKEFLDTPASRLIFTQFSIDKLSKKQETWISQIPPEKASLPTLKSLSMYLDANYLWVATYPYCDSSGMVVFYTIRLESKESGKKIVLPLSFGQVNPNAEPSWSLKGHSSRSKLLYRQKFLSQEESKPVLIVEGEKTADAAHKLIGKDYIVVSWCGGASAAKEANWKLLYGRDIVIWPDNDVAGYKAADDIGRSLRHVGVNSLKIVSKEILKDLPQKWDLADELPKGKDSKFIENSILRGESKAIGLDKITTMAHQYGLTVKQANDHLCEIDDRVRKELEAINGSKTWLTEASILEEAKKLFSNLNNLSATSSNQNIKKKVEREIMRQQEIER